MLMDKTGKFEVLASDYAKTIVRSYDGDVAVVGYRWDNDNDDEVDRLIWFVDAEGENTIQFWNETEAEEW
jgi:hypothetical protein